MKNILIKLVISRKSDTWKIQLTIAINFISSIDSDQQRVMHSKMDDIEIMINDETDEVIKELFDSLKNRRQNNLESIKGSEYVFDYVHLLYYKFHKINSNRSGGSYIDYPDWIKKQNPINKNDNKCFQNAVTVALNHDKIGKNPEKITKPKPYVDK